MEKRTFLLFAAMPVLFAIYATMSLQTMPDAQESLKAQTELLNSLDEGVSVKTARN